MKTSTWLLALLAVVFLVPSCVFLDDDDEFFGCVDGSGPIVEQTLNIEEFESIRLDISADVYLEQGPEQIVKVSGQQNIINKLERDVRNDTWEIEFDGCVFNYEGVVITITTPDLESISINSSGDVYGLGVFSLDDLDININGSGDLEMDLEIDELNVSVNGSGDSSLGGYADLLDIDINASGEVEAFNLESRITTVRTSGSGDTKVFVTDDLKVVINGSGDVYYIGEPDLDIDINGSGDVIDAN
jgi:hypothetical protein